MFIKKPFISTVANKLISEANDINDLSHLIIHVLDPVTYEQITNWCTGYFNESEKKFNYKLKRQSKPYSSFYFFINSNNLWGKTLEEVIILHKLSGESE